MAKAPILLIDEITLPPALVRVELEALPAIIRARRTRAVKQYFDWCDERRLD